MSIKAVLFDLDETLIERVFEDPETFHKILGQKRIQISVGEVEKAFIEVKRELGDTFEKQHGIVSLSEFCNLWIFHILKTLRIEDREGDITREISSRWMDVSSIKIYPDVRPVLTALKAKGLKTGIVSGAYEEEIRRMLEIGGLDEELFDVIVGSDTVKKRKPSPEIFRYALNQLKIKPEEAIYVGNDLERDYKATEGMGMIPFLIVRSENTVLEDLREIRSLMSVMDYLD